MDENQATFCGKKPADMSKDELINALFRMGGAYENLLRNARTMNDTWRVIARSRGVPPPANLEMWDKRIVIFHKRVGDLLHALARIKGHAQEESDDAQSDLRAIYKIATEAIATDLKTKTDGEKNE